VNQLQILNRRYIVEGLWDFNYWGPTALSLYDCPSPIAPVTWPKHLAPAGLLPGQAWITQGPISAIRYGIDDNFWCYVDDIPITAWSTVQYPNSAPPVPTP
jgi:hypothetical protein